MKINYPFIKGRGFTLIELMVVIAIIGILTAIVTANFAQTKAKARDAKRVSDLAQLQLTLEQFFDRCNAYPSELTPIATAGGCPTNPTSDTNDPDYNLPLKLRYFISAIPQDTFTNTAYNYYVKNDGYDYVLGATLETNSSALSEGASFPTNIGASIFPGSTNDCTHSNPNGPYYYCVVPK